MRAQRELQAALCVFVLLAVLPAPETLQAVHPRVVEPLDAAGRVPISAVLLGGERSVLAPESRLLSVSAEGQGTFAPRSRSDLERWLGRTGARAIDAQLAGRTEPVRLAVVRETGAERVLRDAPTFVGGLALLGLALLLPGRRVHPAVAPLFAACFATGTLLLAQLDLVLGEATSWLPIPGIRARVASAALMALPAAWIDLAMRFPRSGTRIPGAAMLPYACWGIVAVFAQVHLEDAALRNVLDRMALGAGTVAFVWVLIGLAIERPGRPIERARAAVLFISAAAAAGFALSAARGWSPAGWTAGLIALSLGVLPCGVAVAVLRYGLAELPRWAPTLASLLPVTRRRERRERAMRETLDRLSLAVCEAKTADDVSRGLREAVAECLPAEECSVLHLSAGDHGRTVLERSGVRLWRAAGAPRTPVRVKPRRADPTSDRAELALSITPACGRRLLVVLSGRRDGLPWSAADDRTLLSFVPVALTALDAVAQRAELADRVAEQTAKLRGAVEDREKLLIAAREVSEAECEADVHAAIARVRAGCSEQSIERRAAELDAPLATAALLGELALTRLSLLADLRREVDRQAEELAKRRSDRLHAEFVRGVAHELRKPLDSLVRELDSFRADPPGGPERLVRALGAGAELGRRLDLLLVHSGLRLDRQRFDLVAASRRAIADARDRSPSRDFSLAGAARLPVIGDPARVSSVLENLLDNAIRATRARDAITLRVATALSRGVPYAVVEVEDEGCGVAEQDRERIFEPGVSRLAGGFGLGLSLCRQIVELHGGSLDLEVRAGRTVFRARWPRVSADPAAEDVEDAA